MPHDLPRAMAISSPSLESGVDGDDFQDQWQDWLQALENQALEIQSRTIVQIRAKTLSAKILGQVVGVAKRIVRRNLLVLNARVDVAMALEVDGVQLPEHGLPVRAVRSLAGSDFWIGRSVHDLAGVRAAASQGADWVTLAPIFDPISKESSGPPLGVEILAEAAEYEIPVFALGGVTTDNIGVCRESGAYGVAGISLYSAVAGALDTEPPKSDIIDAESSEQASTDEQASAHQQDSLTMSSPDRLGKQQQMNTASQDR